MCREKGINMNIRYWYPKNMNLPSLLRKYPIIFPFRSDGIHSSRGLSCKPYTFRWQVPAGKQRSAGGQYSQDSRGQLYLQLRLALHRGRCLPGGGVDHTHRDLPAQRTQPSAYHDDHLDRQARWRGWSRCFLVLPGSSPNCYGDNWRGRTEEDGYYNANRGGWWRRGNTRD